MGSTSFTWTGAVLQPVTEGISDALGASVPIGIGIMGLILGIKIVRKVITGFI